MVVGLSNSILTASNLSNIPSLLHGFTTRLAGDFRTHSSEQLADILGLPLSSFRFLEQVHGGDVVAVTGKACSKPWPEGDAMITEECQVILAIRVADCFPILLVDLRNHAIGIAHAGWRGTLARVLSNTICSMKERFGTRPDELKIAIGPGIGPDHLEVSKEIASCFEDQLQTWSKEVIQRGESAYLNLARINGRLAEEEGVQPSQVWSSEHCTYADAESYFSYRRDGKDSGRMVAFLGWSS